MIIYVPDKVDIELSGVEIGCLCSLSTCECLRTDKPTLADIGLVAAKGAFSWPDYLRLIRRAVVSTRREVYAVVPDAFCDVQKTIENWHRYVTAIRRLGARTVLVMQLFYRDIDAYLPLLDDVDIVALPARQHCDVRCARQPRLCAERIEKTLRVLRGYKIHLLGPAARILKILATGGILREIHSFDTSAYRMAPNNNVKTCANGRWMITRGDDASVWLREWLRSAGLL